MDDDEIVQLEIEENPFAEFDAKEQAEADKRDAIIREALATLRSQKVLAFTWEIEDVKSTEFLGRTELNDEQAWEVLQKFYHKHDCDLTISDWDELRMWADHMYPLADTAEDDEPEGNDE